MAWVAREWRTAYGRRLMGVVRYSPGTIGEWEWQVVVTSGVELASGLCDTPEAAQAAADAWIDSMVEEVSNAR